MVGRPAADFMYLRAGEAARPPLTLGAAAHRAEQQRDLGRRRLLLSREAAASLQVALLVLSGAVARRDLLLASLRE